MNAEDYYKRIVNELYRFIEKAGGRVSFSELAKWAEENNVGSITLSIALNDLIEEGKISAPEGFFEPEDYIVAYPVPRIVAIRKGIEVEKSTEASSVEEVQTSSSMCGAAEEKIESLDKVLEVKEAEKTELKPVIEEAEEHVADEDLEKAIEYLNDYWSVGIIRFLEDLKMLGISKPDLVLRKLVDLGYVTYSPIGVVNATGKLPKVKRSRRLSEFI